MLSRLAAFESFLKENSFAFADADRRQQALKLLMAVNTGVGDNYIAEKLGDVDQLLIIFYSERRHASYRGGPSAIYAKIMYSLVPRIRDHALSCIENGKP